MKKHTITILLIFLLPAIMFAQQFQRQGGVISGKIIDQSAKQPIEYATIILFSAQDSSQVNGTVTDKQGNFKIAPVRPGNYYIDIQFISYEKKRVGNISVSRENPFTNIGTIEITATSINLGNVVVEGQRSPVSYQIDKKVIDVNQMATSMSGNAADVLANVPSVTVDIEGNVSLRGSTNFTVLVDGRPSVLDAQDILQQIPASTIEKIEIITNPSAKYKADGAAGIVNILLKKSTSSGISGVTNLNTGWHDKYGGSILVQYKNPSIGTNFGVDYNDMTFPGTGRTENRTLFGGVSTNINSDGTGSWGRKMLGLRAGVDFNLGEFDQLSFSGRYGDRDMVRTNDANYEQWSNLSFAHLFYGDNSYSKRGGTFFALSANYNHKFTPEHTLSSDFSVRRNNSTEESVTENFSNDLRTAGIRTTESGPETEMEGKIDYVLPLNLKSKFMAGYDGEVEIGDDNTGFYRMDSLSGIYIYNDPFSHGIKSNISQHAFYSMYSNEIGNLGFQAGLRLENTYRTIKVDKNNEFDLNEWDWFPSIHTSFSITQGEQIMASYSRRIQRPNGWNLEPFDTWSDANNVRRGNPSLKPILSDSYEAGYKTFFGDASLSTELYYRVSHNRIEDVRSAYAENVTLTTFANVGNDYSLGSEIMLNFGFGKLWDINLMGNLYDYRIDGTLYNESFSRKSFNWNSRMNNIIRLAEDTQLQVNGSYSSPSVSSQGERKGFFSTDVAVKQTLFSKALSLTLQVRDLLGTARYEFTSSGPDFYNYTYFQRDSPVVMLNIRYNINNFKSDEERQRPEDTGDEGQEPQF